MKYILLAILIISIFPLFAQTETMTYDEEVLYFQEKHKQEHVKNERSPIKEVDLVDLRFFEPNEDYSVTCTFERTPDEKPFDLPTYSGIKKQYIKYGILKFELNGKSLQLAVYQSLRLQKIPGYSDYLFLPFRDATNDDSTYGGGRYIDMKVADIEGENIVLDFNRCYNPWCCYSDGFNCPIPPSENTLDVPIEAGEMMFAGEKKH